MQYGFFDNEKKEYVITSPDTPMPWINYLGTEDYASLISNNAGGYAFYRSASSRRMLRFRFNSIPRDRPGRYLYIRDNEDGDYWSASWQPVGKDLDEYRNECRHGLGYTRFISEYRGIKSNYRVFVPVDKPIEFWEMELENKSNRRRELSVFSYAEWCFWYMEQDLKNFQYILYTCRMDYEDNIIDYSIRLWPVEEPKAFMASVLPVESFDTDREEFIGGFNSESSPLAVERGKCSNSIAVGGNPCGALQNKVVLEPGEKKWVTFIVGIGDAKNEGKQYLDRYSSRNEIEKEFSRLGEYWEKRLHSFGCQTPSEDLNTMVNIWNQYQCHTTFNWSRSASFNEAGGRDGLGFRDTNQDTLGVVHVLPEQVKKKIVELFKGQLSEGYAMHGIRPFDWEQGRHNIPDREKIFSDDHLWLLISTGEYLRETGDLDFLLQEVPFADQGKASVYEHLKRALDFSRDNRGPHGLLLGLAADWNDCINLSGKGESVWSTFLYYRALKEFLQIARRLEQKEDLDKYEKYRIEIETILNEYAWDGNWFIRGYLDSGRKLGSVESDQSRIFLNSQTWAIVSGFSRDKKAQEALNSVDKYLATEHGNLLNYPAFKEPDSEVGAATTFPPGLKENGGIFCHANTWSIIAAALLGRGDKAFQYYQSYLPARNNERADEYTMEPYVYSQFITGAEHPYHFGRARNSWLTGTAAWSFRAVTNFILGVRAHYDGLLIDPCVPEDWEQFEVYREFRGKEFEISVKNPSGVNKGISEVKVNGEKIEGNLIFLEMMKKKNQVQVTMG
ncbi:MAG: GH36-type glycosyl hydrolase domain-containing protein [Halanaerobiaceae bacterium]